MYVAVLRVSAQVFDPDAFLQTHALEAATIWRAGELGPGGRVRPESGFNVTIANVALPGDLASEVRFWLEQEEHAVRALRDAGLRPTIDVGLSVDTEARLTASVTFPAADLHRLAELGLSLAVSAYAAP